jgi:hypothetical protein
MEREEIQRLLDRFRAGEASDNDKANIELLLLNGSLELEEIEDLSVLSEQVAKLGFPQPSTALDKRFYDLLADEQRTHRRSSSSIRFFTWPQFIPKLALASLMLAAGIAVGYLLRSPGGAPQNDQVHLLSKQVSDLQEMMMLSLLEKGSATERLKAVGLTQEMDDASKKVTNALIKTLNEDDNVNVRLAALEALKPYTGDGSVREALIRSISRQESPLVQMSLAELMVALQEKSAVKELEKIVKSEKTPAEVKQKIQESVNVLI